VNRPSAMSGLVTNSIKLARPRIDVNGNAGPPNQPATFCAEDEQEGDANPQHGYPRSPKRTTPSPSADHTGYPSRVTPSRA
jgi:hypothetical protein